MDDDWADDFDLAPTAQGSAADPLVDTEYARLQQRYTDAGYREGIGEGKLSTLQGGFDEGFASSVPPARRIGQLRGRANALLAITLSSASSSSSSSSCLSPSAPSPYPSSSTHPSSFNPTFSSSAVLVDTLRALVADLGAVKRDDVLPIDHERLAHEAEHHADDDDAFELARTDRRDMEGLEDALGRLGGNPKDKEGEGLREEALLASLEQRVAEAEERVLA